ncbi:MAG: ribulose-phosphate 3-epimerase [Bacilli bacterium]|jgi:ribulose-phosphate 3-epimerase|nr:ribulose-phosphate 3-epimerase [Bacilli bacterium]
MRIVAPSILSCNFMDLKNEIIKINDSKAEWIHFDVMDGHFVPNLTFGPDIFKYFKNNSNKFMDVHIMVSNPMFIAQLFIEAKASQIVFHYEACQNENEIYELINYIKSKDIKVGISIKPGTDVKVLKPYLNLLDNILVMSVEPGFGGQKFIPNVLDKLSYLKEQRTINNYNYIIQIDGGINNENKELCYEKGADCLVAGSYLFKQEDFASGVESLL